MTDKLRKESAEQELKGIGQQVKGNNNDPNDGVPARTFTLPSRTPSATTAPLWPSSRS